MLKDRESKQATDSLELAKLGVSQIAGRIITQDSRCYLVNEWAKLQVVEGAFKIKDNRNRLYENLNCNSKNKNKTEKKYYIHKSKQRDKKRG